MSERPPGFNRILIAKRGEIAPRVLCMAREKGIEVAAVYSDLDQRARHERLANLAVPLGGATPAESYLSIEKILLAAKRTGSEAIHPGYGFLSENEDFAQAVRRPRVDRAAAEEKKRATEYEETFGNPYMAAERGFVADVIEARTTRPQLIRWLQA